MYYFKKYFNNRRVLITGNTGFKGSWLTFWLLELGARVAGYSEKELTNPSLYENLHLKDKIKQYLGDISDIENLSKSISDFQPDFIFHLAAQSLVYKSIDNPIDTFRTNMLGTATLLEVIHRLNFEGVAIFVTSDKCYENDERLTGYSEFDRLGGKDPYSASKAAAEIAISSYFRTFFNKTKNMKIGIGRAGNVVGGGDWNRDRVIVDCVRSWNLNKKVQLRSPESTRPWQHVLEPLSGYLKLATELSKGNIPSGEAFNFGPDAQQTFTVYEIVERLSRKWPNCPGISMSKDSNFMEAKLLSLNCDKAKKLLKWQSTLELDECVDLIAEWYLGWRDNLDLEKITINQIQLFSSKFKVH